VATFLMNALWGVNTHTTLSALRCDSVVRVEGEVS
jgi:hypothetical protein